MAIGKNYKRNYYIQSIPVALIQSYKFENMLRDFLKGSPNKQKDPNHMYHYRVNKKFKAKDHPRWVKNGCPKEEDKIEMGLMYADEFRALIYGDT